MHQLYPSPAYIRLNCGFPAASDGALERVNQAIQEYRRDVTQLGMSAYYTMISKLTRHGVDAFGTRSKRR